MDGVELWVKDQLHDVLGMSDRHVAQFLVGTARRSSSSSDLLSRLRDTGAIDVTDKVKGFIEELWLRIPQKVPVERPARAVEREALAMQEKNRLYTLLEDSDEEEEEKGGDRKRKKKHLRKRRKEESDSESEKEQ
ncbi:pre-mRNA-splicing factor ATP-dependent RNA helicase DHX16-like [Discoglossus pictus]